MTKRVLCICCRNTIRSVMMQCVIDRIARRRNIDLCVVSAGTHQRAAREEKPATPLTLSVLAEQGMDASMNRSQWIGLFNNLDQFDYILAASDGDAHVARIMVPASSRANISVLTSGGYEITSPIFGDVIEHRSCLGSIIGASEQFLRSRILTCT